MCRELSCARGADQTARRAGERAPGVVDRLNDELGSELRAFFGPDEIREEDIWLRIRMHRLVPDLRAGWKLHLSSTPSSVRFLLRAALPALHRLGLAFKVIGSIDALEELNDGHFGLTQVGKAVTVYPPDETRAAAAADMLRDLLRGFQGPSIPTDFPLFEDAPVYCRYGPFDGRFVVDALGQKRRLLAHPDFGDVIDSADGGALPPPEPSLLARRESPDHLAFLRERFLVLRMLHLSAKGGVFLALPLCPTARRPMIIKTARLGTNADRFGRDALWAITREHGFLRLLAGARGVPEAGELLLDGKHGAAIVRGWLVGQTLWELWTQPDAATPESRRALAQRLAELADCVSEIHSRGVILRDLSPANILSAPGAVTILDWEMAQSTKEDFPAYRRGTPGFYEPAKSRFGVPTVVDDREALLALAFMAESGVHPALSLTGIKGHCVTAIVCTPAFADAFRGASGCMDAGHQFDTAYSALLNTVGRPREQVFDAPDWPRLEDSLRADLDQTLAKVEQSGCDHEDVTVYSGLAGLLLVALECGPDRLLDGVARDRLIAACTRMLETSAVVHHIPGLYFGEPGVAFAVAAVGAYLDVPRLLNAARGVFEGCDLAAQRVPDICHGVAGFALASLGAWNATAHDFFRQCALRSGERLLALASESEQGVFWPWPEGPYGSLSGARLPGFAHGVAGAVYACLRLYECLAAPAFRQVAEHGLDTLTRLSRPLENGEGLWWPFSVDDETCWNAWCHGTPGIAKALARAVRVLGRSEDRELLLRALSGITSANNAGFCLCHGIASRLDAYTDAGEWLGILSTAAARDAAILSALDVYALESCAHGLESSGRSRGLMTGAAGVVRTLARHTGIVNGPFGQLLP